MARPKGTNAEAMAQRFNQVLQYIEKKRVVTTYEIMRVFGLSKAQTWHVLRVLARRGVLVKMRLGKRVYWLIHGYENDVVERIRKAICASLNGFTSQRMCIKRQHVVEHLPPHERGRNAVFVIEHVLKHFGVSYERIKANSHRGVVFCINASEKKKLCY